MIAPVAPHFATASASTREKAHARLREKLDDALRAVLVRAFLLEIHGLAFVMCTLDAKRPLRAGAIASLRRDLARSLAPGGGWILGALRKYVAASEALGELSLLASEPVWRHGVAGNDVAVGELLKTLAEAPPLLGDGRPAPVRVRCPNGEYVVGRVIHVSDGVVRVEYLLDGNVTRFMADRETGEEHLLRPEMGRAPRRRPHYVASDDLVAL